MRLPAVRTRPILPLVMLLAVTAVLTVVPAGPVRAEPGTPGPEGGSASLRDQLDAASRGFNDAAARLEASKARQVQLAEQVRASEAELARLTEQVGTIAANAYKGGRVSGLVALLDSDSPTGMFQRAATLDAQARVSDGSLRRVKQAKAALARQQAALDAELKVQQDQLAEMDRRKKAAEKALGIVGGRSSGVSGGGAGTAAAVPRRADGSLAPESCNRDDPTTSGCLTPRALHALQQARAAGFTRFTSCYRSQQDGGEHPKGRACDFSASTSGFGGVASGGDRDYGNRLAAYFVANARNLGVLYVIWFRQIWMPSTGWRAYNGGGGDPSSDHTNHVHLSVQ
ncbi:hypothetical protein HC028_00205 [Planosporangium flavigriseum]|uniref:coiled-coil domain-containing protein n=1 Tax=Planosporangium flavigriseum TaxID=373681 RepID=UPI001439A733|nr:hypothetical protein [Planosporangium flavigriseum]NJC62946.1 hypothetical protein [Planosporangium flavigriseum]